MPIKQLTPMSEIENYTEEQLNRLNAVLLRNLAYIGEMCLNRARQTDSYKDQTGNLRSSIGYVISFDGRIVKASDFKVVKEGERWRERRSFFCEKNSPAAILRVCALLLWQE